MSDRIVRLPNGAWVRASTVDCIRPLSLDDDGLIASGVLIEGREFALTIHGAEGQSSVQLADQIAATLWPEAVLFTTAGDEHDGLSL